MGRWAQRRRRGGGGRIINTMVTATFDDETHITVIWAKPATATGVDPSEFRRETDDGEATVITAVNSIEWQLTFGATNPTPTALVYQGENPQFEPGQVIAITF